jgi:hypothetical protein
VTWQFSSCRRKTRSPTQTLSQRQQPHDPQQLVGPLPNLALMDQGAPSARGAACACGLRPFTAAPALGVFLRAEQHCLRRGPHDSGMTGPNRPGTWIGVGVCLPACRSAQSGPIRSHRRGQGRSSSGALHLDPPASPDRATRGLNGRREDARVQSCAGAVSVAGSEPSAPAARRERPRSPVRTSGCRRHHHMCGYGTWWNWPSE